MMKRIAVGTVLLSVLLILALAGCDTTQAVPVKPTPTAAAPIKGIPAGQRIIAAGHVTPIKHADLNLNAAGTVVEVLAAEGDTVKKDQPLLRVDSRQQAAAVAQAETALTRAQANQARAQAGQTRAQAVLAKAQAALAQLKAPSRPTDLALARTTEQVAEAELVRVQAGADQGQLIAAKATMEKDARAVQQAQAAYDRVKDAPFGSIGAEALRLEQTTIDYEAAKAQYEQLALLPRAIDVDVAKAHLAQVQATIAQAQAGASPEAIAAAEADIAAAEADVAAAEAGLNGSAADVASATTALAQAKAALSDTELRAPFDGVVVMLNVRAGETVSAGALVPPGSFAVRLADLSVWQIETTDLSELNIDNVHEGEPVILTFDAISGLELPGKVAKIRTYGDTKQGDIVYTVFITPAQQDPRLYWNMTAKVNIESQ
jgi:HlyD family secretion protein